ncbi:MAG: tRNA 2-thiouridine(34) synthase MnmA [Gammaproteobacteria bacterium]
MSERVIVGMSGGVDSSVAALLLKQAGYEVHGLFMHNWEEDEEGYCQSAEDYQDALAVAELLEVPLHRANFAREYRQQVFRHFVDGYARGVTPNPDVLCNREIKFGSFLSYARRLGGDRIATGHYARTDGHGRLLRAADPGKDQTYFLHAVSADALRAALFPIGHLLKEQVRALAKAEGLPNHDRRDSTGICFIGERPFAEFLGRYVPGRPGEIRTPEDRVVGRHEGLARYTLGQRQGLRVGGVPGADEAPWYVAEKDEARNVLVVVQGHDHPLLMRRSLLATDASWVAGTPPDLPLDCTARTRHRQPDLACRVSAEGAGRLRVNFDEPQRAPAPGQYVVFYRDDECLGGATIAQTTAEGPARPLRSAAG